MLEFLVISCLVNARIRMKYQQNHGGTVALWCPLFEKIIVNTDSSEDNQLTKICSKRVQNTKFNVYLQFMFLICFIAY